MQVTDEMIEEAMAVHVVSSRENYLRRVLTAALSKAEPVGVGVKVKPLTWRAYGNQHLKGWQGVGRMGYLAYVTNTGPDGETGWFFDNDKQFDTVEDAKAAAQADFEQRILSALSLPCKENGETVTPSQDVTVGRWLPIAQADRTITDVQDFSEVGIMLRTSDHYWVRDEDGRVYEACWSEGEKSSYWWDFGGESPVDPVEFMPHPLDPKYAATGADR